MYVCMCASPLGVYLDALPRQVLDDIQLQCQQQRARTHTIRVNNRDSTWTQIIAYVYAPMALVFSAALFLLKTVF